VVGASSEVAVTPICAVWSLGVRPVVAVRSSRGHFARRVVWRRARGPPSVEDRATKLAEARALSQERRR